MHREQEKHALAQFLHQALSAHSKGSLGQWHTTGPLEFTQTVEIKTMGTHSVSFGCFHPVSSYRGIAIVLYVTAATAGFGMFYDVGEHGKIYQIDTHDVVSMWIKDPENEQRDALLRLHENIEQLLGTTHS